MAIKINGNPRLQAYQTEVNRKVGRNGADFDLENAGLKKDEKSRGEDPGVILEIGKKKTEAGSGPKAAALETSAGQKDSYVKSTTVSKESENAGETQAASGTSFAEMAAKVWNTIKEAVSKFFKELWNGPESKNETFPDALEEAERRREGLSEDDEFETVRAETRETEIEETVSTAAEAGTKMAAETVPAEGKLAGGVSGAREERPDTMEDFLNGTQKAKAVHNTDILTYYDRSGKMVKIRDKGRIIDGK